MKTSVERLEGTMVRLSVTVPAKQVEAAVADAYAKTAERVNIPGFRKGKAPRQVLDQRVGRESVLADAQEAIIAHTYPLALEAEGLRTIDAPDMGELDEVVPGTEYTYTAEVELRPELELSSCDGLSITVPPKQSTDREIEAQLDYMRDRYATLDVVEDRSIQVGDFALISFVGTIDGEEYEGNRVDKYNYETGRDLMPAEFEAAVIGKKAGESTSAEFVISEGSSNPDFVGKTASFDITVHEVKAKTLPAADDAFAATVGGYENIGELRDDIRKRLDSAKETGHARRIEIEARAALAERLQGEVPDAMVEGRTRTLLEEFLGTLQSRGMSFEQYLAAADVSPERIMGDLRLKARAILAEELALEALFRAQGMELTDGDIEHELQEIAGQNGDVEDVRRNVLEAGAMPLIREHIMHRKATMWLMDNTEVVEKDSTEGVDSEDETAAAAAAASTGKASAKKTTGAKKRAKAAKEADAEDGAATKEE